MRARILDARDAAVDRDVERGPRALQPIDAIVVERRNVTILAWREAVEPSLARVHDQRIDAGRHDNARECIERLFRILLVDAEAALHRDRNPDSRLHRGNALTDKLRLGHQAGAEAPFPYAIRRTPHIQIDLIVAEVGANARTLRQRARVRSAE